MSDSTLSYSEPWATLDGTVTWLNCSLTDLFLDGTVPWLNSYLTELFLDWSVPWRNCSLTELLLDWTVTWMNFHCTVTWLKCSLTELLLDWTELLLVWTLCIFKCPYLGSFSTKLPLNSNTVSKTYYLYICFYQGHLPSSLSTFCCISTTLPAPWYLRKCSGHLEEVDAASGLPCAWRDLSGSLQNDDKATNLTSPIRGKRQVARRAGSTYAPEFLGLLEVALMKDSWTFLLKMFIVFKWWVGGIGDNLGKIDGRWNCLCLFWWHGEASSGKNTGRM